MRRKGTERLHRDQYAFIPQISFELCKKHFFRTMLNRRQEGLATVNVFIDSRFAYDRVDRILLLKLLRD